MEKKRGNPVALYRTRKGGRLVGPRSRGPVYKKYIVNAAIVGNPLENLALCARFKYPRAKLCDIALGPRGYLQKFSKCCNERKIPQTGRGRPELKATQGKLFPLLLSQQRKKSEN